MIIEQGVPCVPRRSSSRRTGQLKQHEQDRDWEPPDAMQVSIGDGTASVPGLIKVLTASYATTRRNPRSVVCTGRSTMRCDAMRCDAKALVRDLNLAC
ncbi:hypothetical protein CFAM422_009225 [Trichoderma lentiforme]|uniref:Uncharacterized protein n=1 Tax=Trichoderma lentiforme TaxID=1567552 RepID=A0A9P4XA39_9HYPO|nr:hypothetical protein CFAM422_009225 [Trichoderma lentiforme]